MECVGFHIDCGTLAKGVGVVLEVQVKGGPERVELVEFTKP